MGDFVGRRSSRLTKKRKELTYNLPDQVNKVLDEDHWSDNEPTPKRIKKDALDLDGGDTEEDAKDSLIVTLKLPQILNPNPNPNPNPRPVKNTRKPKVKASPEPELVDQRLPSQGRPLVYADTRFELCAALPYYNSYQGGAAASKGNVKGLLLDGYCGDRSYMDEEVILTRAGGGREQDEVTGKSVQTKDQNSKNFRIAAFENNLTKGVPIQVIVGSNNYTCPSKIPYRYCVMGPFQITDIWAEKCDGHVVYKYKFQKTNLETRSWWAPQDSNYQPGISLAIRVEVAAKKCEDCGEASKQVYQQGWICLNPACRVFWSIEGTPASKVDLQFNQDFLAERAPPTQMIPTFPTVPVIEDNLSSSEGLRTASYSKLSWAGVVCPECGRCNQRRHWSKWTCLAEGCNWEFSPYREIITAAAVMGDQVFQYEGHALSEDKFTNLVDCDRKVHGFFNIHEYHLLHEGLKITHLHANRPLNATKGGADDVFRGLQESSLGLQRLSMPGGATSGAVTNHFVKNYGLPYQYIVKHPELSTSFAEAPVEIRQVMRRLLWVGNRAVENGTEISLNECLVVGYFLKGSMGYHDDGEKTLGPDVVAWSLGGPADMHFRMKIKYFSGFTSERKHYHPEFPILPGCFKPEVRQHLNSLATTMTEEELTARARKDLSGCPIKAPDFLVMKLRHGDFMSMHGAPMQMYYEHSVVANQELRFGVTGRFVIPEMISEDQRTKGDLPLDPAATYDGDLKAFNDWKEK